MRRFSLRNFTLRTKILTVSGVFFAGMVATLVVGASIIVSQYNAIEEAIEVALTKVSSANSTRSSIASMDRNIQSLIATDDSQAIRQSAIVTIRNGAAIDEELARLKEFFPEDDADILALLGEMEAIRPKQMQIIGAARKNDDTRALQLSENINEEFSMVTKTADAVVSRSEQDLLAAVAQKKAEAFRLFSLLGILASVGILFGFFVAYAGSTMISRPLKRVQETLAAMAKGDLTQNIMASGRGRDEVASTIRYMKDMLTHLREMVNQIAQASQSVGTETQGVTVNANSIRESTVTLDEIVGGVDEESKNVSVCSVNALDKASRVVDIAGFAAETAEKSTEDILQVVDSFDQFQTKIEGMAEDSERLSEIAKQISTITGTIVAISEQTNMLALNAAIEAARAGEQGRGFAVVADEVRTLAGRTSDAVEEITGHINKIGTSIETTVASVRSARDDVAKNIELLRVSAEKSNENRLQSVEISAEMQDLTNMIQNASAASKRINSTIAELTQVSTQNNHQANSLIELANSLGQAADELKQVVNRFEL